MLTQAEIETAMNIDASSEEDYVNDHQKFEELSDLAAERNRVHAGTGGSSKLRSRPA